MKWRSKTGPFKNISEILMKALLFELSVETAEIIYLSCDQDKGDMALSQILRGISQDRTLTFTMCAPVPFRKILKRGVEGGKASLTVFVAFL